MQNIQAEASQTNRLEELANKLISGDTEDLERNEKLKTSLSSGDLESQKINGWRMSGCDIDKFTGSKNCSMSKDDLIVYIHKGKTFFIVGVDHFPRRSSALRIDGNKPIYGSEGAFQNNAKILEQFKTGKVVNTRYVQWPYEINRDAETSLDGFNEAYKELQRQYRN